MPQPGRQWCALSSAALVITAASAQDADIRRLSRIFRGLSLPVIGRIANGKLLLDLRCLEREQQFERQLSELSEQL